MVKLTLTAGRSTRHRPDAARLSYLPSNLAGADRTALCLVTAVRLFDHAQEWPKRVIIANVRPADVPAPAPAHVVGPDCKVVAHLR